MQLYFSCVKTFGWSLCEIDNTSLDTMMAFVFFREKPAKDELIYKGKVYKKTQGAPAWL